jgi:recombination protein RecR
MIELPDNLKEAIESVNNLPGIGKKSAFRLVMAMSKWSEEELFKISNSIKGITNTKYCNKCKLFSDEDLCKVCSNDSRKIGSLCIVESIVDLMAIENSGQYKGRYFILGGVLNPLAGIGPEELELYKLFKVISEDSITEIILAVNPSIEGDATCSYINQVVSQTVKVERIGFGIPIGGSLEYLDPLTISKALENKRIL